VQVLVTAKKFTMHSLGKSSEVMNDFDSTCHIHRTDGVSTHSVVFILYMESSWCRYSREYIPTVGKMKQSSLL